MSQYERELRMKEMAGYGPKNWILPLLSTGAFALIVWALMLTQAGYRAASVQSALISELVSCKDCQQLLTLPKYEQVIGRTSKDKLVLARALGKINAKNYESAHLAVNRSSLLARDKSKMTPLADKLGSLREMAKEQVKLLEKQKSLEEKIKKKIRPKASGQALKKLLLKLEETDKRLNEVETSTRNFLINELKDRLDGKTDTKAVLAYNWASKHQKSFRENIKNKPNTGSMPNWLKKEWP